MRQRNFWWIIGVAGLALVAGALSWGMHTAYGGLGGGYYAYSPIVTKFVDRLPGLGRLTPLGTDDRSPELGTFIPIAIPDTATFTGADYYQIGEIQYTQSMHTELPGPTTLRGYRDLGPSATPAANSYYLGPLIIATRDRPVRIKFANQLATSPNDKLFIPTDYTLMGAGPGPGATSPPYSADWYTQNRTAVHLHGGVTPWISDGTPWQWYTPSGEGATYTKGASFQNVPDVTTPPDGSQTMYYTNQQSNRLMFYHDHAVGITRLNVYAGMAAGYLITDPQEEALITAGILPFNSTGLPAQYRYGIPLIIQDKTFVANNIDAQDAKWNQWRTANGITAGLPGDLWFPHIYEPTEDPFNPGPPNFGANPVGRWDYGPWFWPPVPAAKTLPDSNPNVPTENYLTSIVPESFVDTPVVNGAAYPYLVVDPKAYRFRILNACNDRTLNLQLYVADPNAVQPTGFSSEVKMIPAVDYSKPVFAPIYPNTLPAIPYPGSAAWPVDNRDGGVPDWNGAGPSWIQIGTEGGFLPAPAVIPPKPVSYAPVTLNVLNKSLFMGPAERADVIVDFSAFPGKTIILYNDGPAPAPGFDPRYDFYTGDPDQTSAGGAPTTLAGFGPNTRTIMQFRVNYTAPATTYDLAALRNTSTGLPAAYAASQPTPIVPQAAYGAPDGPYPATYTDTYVPIQDNTITYTPYGQSTPETRALLPKAIAEQFDVFGRLNALLGTELTASFTPVGLQYIDPATETIGPGETQFWKITHNGVDTHTVHFHLVNVQVINRVGWDRAIRPPDPNELGWKEAVRMNPMEDCIVAVRAIQPSVPFAVPDSIRLLAPALPPGPQPDFTNIDPNTGLPITVSNDLTNFGWEYVWHCHLLGHEESDMMRPFVFNPNASFQLFWRNTSTGQNVIWYMNGVNENASAYLLPVDPASGWQIAGTGDFNGDGRPDLLWRNSLTGQNVVWFMDGSTFLGAAVLPTVDPALGYQLVGVGDFNADSKPDILWRNTLTGQNVVWYMDGVTETGYALLPSVDPASGWQIMGVGDFNSDGKSDIVWRNTLTGANVVWYMDGITQTGYAFLPSLDPSSTLQLVAVGDFNQDVYPDLLWRDSASGATTVWFMKDASQIGTGTITPAVLDLTWQLEGRH